MANVKIALRIRPLSEKELEDEISSQCVVVMEDNKTIAITNPKVPSSNAGDSRERTKLFSFDYCFNSSTPTEDNYATQDKIYQDLGGLILESLDRGQDACVLAYGQSASGKTHTMQGTSAHPGLTPRLCQALMEAEAEGVISYYEIYNERVRDLLTIEDLEPHRTGDGIGAHQGRTGPVAERALKELRVREHPTRGPYVEGLTGLAVRGPQQTSALVTLASRRRRAARTPANPRSSRSHAVLAIRRNTPTATLTLLDLAGSERPSKVSQSLPRQKEGANINKSLVALANVISALVSPNPRGNRYVPYRDSVLTWLLKDTLAGRTTTVMIATVSPSRASYTETVHTMRWASRAGRLPPSQRAPDAPHERALRALRAEVAHLRALLRQATAAIAAPPTKQITADSKQTTDFKVNEGAGTSHANDLVTQEVSEDDCTIKEEKTIDDSKEDNKEGGNSLNSLASSRLSIASNDTASGNNSIPSTQGSNVNSSQAEDALFGPRMHRTGSVHDVKPFPPLRNKKRQYSSHEVLPSLDKSSATRTKSTPASKAPTLSRDISNLSSSNTKGKFSYLLKGKSVNNTDAEKMAKSKVAERLIEKPVDADKNNTPNVYQPFNKRANIVASVTDRLYSKMKKEEAVINKMETVGEKKPTQTLNELKICSNARKRLFDISHRALRASRRLRVGVAAETQTDNFTAVRVKEVAIDVQEDIEPFQKVTDNKMYKNASMETEAVTLMCKEASVGTLNGNLYNDDKNVGTDKTNEFSKLVITRTCGNMTENNNFLSNSAATQTLTVLSDKKKDSSFTKYLKVHHAPPVPIDKVNRSQARVLNISILHDCIRFDNETDGLSDDSLEGDIKRKNHNSNSIMTPDLLNDHSSNESLVNNTDPCCSSSLSSDKVEAANKNVVEGSLEVLSDSSERKVADTGNKASPKRAIIECELPSECRNISNLTIKADSAINREGARVSPAGKEVITEPRVTCSILQEPDASPILRRDIPAGGSDTNLTESRSRESKSIQVGFPRASYADFIDDVFIPLPRVRFDSQYCEYPWQGMKDLIMGRNENVYPYNIKGSPKRHHSLGKKSCKSVSWGETHQECERRPRSNTDCRKPIIKNDINHGQCTKSLSHIPSSPKFHCDSDSEGKDVDIESNDRSFSSGSHCPDGRYFKGVRCWNDRYSDCKEPPRFDREKRESEKCLDYIKATSNFLTEATNLVTTLNKVSTKLHEPQISQFGQTRKETLHSPIRKEKLRTDDENANESRTKTQTKDIQSPIKFSIDSYLLPSYDKSSSNSNVSSLLINDKLVSNDEQTKNFNSYFHVPPLFYDSADDAAISSDEELLKNNNEKIDMVEKELLESLDRLESCTQKSSEYFRTIKNKYSHEFNGASAGPSLSNVGMYEDISPSPYPRAKRTPSKYLQQLLELRKDLVESTKRDEDICKNFQTC